MSSNPTHELEFWSYK